MAEWTSLINHARMLLPLRHPLERGHRIGEIVSVPHPEGPQPVGA